MEWLILRAVLPLIGENWIESKMVSSQPMILAFPHFGMFGAGSNIRGVGFYCKSLRTLGLASGKPQALRRSLERGTSKQGLPSMSSWRRWVWTTIQGRPQGQTSGGKGFLDQWVWGEPHVGSRMGSGIVWRIWPGGGARWASFQEW